jgi:defect in organelle trafficking protein DotB
MPIKKPDDDKQFLIPNEPSRFSATFIDDLLYHCEKFEASDITIQTNESIVAEVFGRLKKITLRRVSNTEVGDMLNFIYGQNGTAQLLTGKDVDTHYEFKPNRSERYRYRVNGTACQVEGNDGMQLTLRSIPFEPPDLDTLQLEPEILKNIAPYQGVVYVTGATGSGKSTLLASIIKEIARDPNCNRKILTYESPIEFVYDSVEMQSAIVSQSEIPRHLPSFAAGVRNALRRKPRLILVGESRDEETISAVLEAALTGHPVYTTLHSNGVAESIRRLVSSFSKEERTGRTIDIIETIRLIIWQKLVPATDGKRVPLREYLIFDDNVRDKLLGSNLDNITEETRKVLEKFGRPMIIDAEEKYKEGRIDERTFKLLLKGSEGTDTIGA